MKIDDRPRPGNGTARKPERAAAPREEALTQPQSPNTPNADRVHLSPRAREYDNARQALASLPDEASEKVQAIRDRIQNGRYRIDTEKIATNMIREALTNDD